MTYNAQGSRLGVAGKHAEAVAVLLDALKLKPGDKDTINNLILIYNSQGTMLNISGKHAEAVAAYRKALDLKPDDAWTWQLLGNALVRQGKVAEGKAAFRKSLELNPGDPLSRFQLWAAELVDEDQEAIAELDRGNALFLKGNYADACTAYRRAVELRPNWPAAHWNLGTSYRWAGELTKALEEMKRCQEFGPPSVYKPADVIPSLQQLVELDRKLPGLADGREKPGNADRIALAWLCAVRKYPHAAARFYAEAFAANPEVAAQGDGRRCNAACAAAQAAAGQGKDADKLDDKERSRLRQQALSWLKADLASWAKQAESDLPKDREVVQQKMKHWQTDADLAGVRDKDALSKLPEAERDDWRKLWDDVAALLKKAEERK